MAVRPIVRLGHPSLRTPAKRVEAERLRQPELQALIDDMIDTMREASGVGLAAPQLGIDLQIFVYEVPGAATEEAPAAPAPVAVVVNPMLEPEAGDLVYDWEGCLSIPGLRGLVPRHPGVRVHGIDRHGEPVDVALRGLAARVAQHEYDHLNGVVYLDRMRDLRSLTFEEELERYLLPEEKEPPSSAVG